MENREYESPKITVINLEPDESLMGDNTVLPGAPSTGNGTFGGASNGMTNEPPDLTNGML